MIISASLESRNIRIVLSDNVDDSKVVEDVDILPEITNIIEDTPIYSDTLIIDEVHLSTDNISDDVMR